MSPAKAFLRAVELSPFCTWVRQTDSIWAYPFVLFLHTVGLAFVVGISVAVSLRILGFAPGIPLKPLDKFYPLMWVAFWVNAISGTILLATDATVKMANPLLYIKLSLIALAVISVQMTRNQVFRGEDRSVAAVPARAKLFAFAAIVFWLAAITTGRMLAYLTPTHIVGVDS